MREPVRGDFRARAHGAASAGSFVQFGVARSVAVSHALERGLRSQGGFRGGALLYDHYDVMTSSPDAWSMYVLPFDRHVG